MPGYAGFDSSFYPGDPAMTWLRQKTNFTWCGFYLGPAPSHGGTSWMAKRAFLVDAGWGLAPIYVGQQTIGPGSHCSSPYQGYVDGADAAGLLTDAGFPSGSCAYLDLENGLPCPPEQLAYVRAWADRMVDAGFAPGVYCSHLLALDIHQVVPEARIWAFRVDTTAPHPVPGRNFPDFHPAGCGYSGAFAWQLAQNGLIGVPQAPNGRLIVDLDTAVSPDPGAPDSDG